MSSSSEYSELYAVPKDSFNKYIKYRLGNFPNVRNLKVQQLNFNEAKKLNTFQSHTATAQKPGADYKQLNVTTKVSNQPGVALAGNQNTANANIGTGQRLGEASNVDPNLNQSGNNSGPDLNQSANNEESGSNLDVSDINPPNDVLQNQLTADDIKRLNDMRDNAAWDPNIVKQSQSTFLQAPIPPPRLSSTLNNDDNENINQSTDSNPVFYSPKENTEKGTVGIINKEENLFHTSRKRGRSTISSPITPDRALKQVEKNLKDISAPRATKDFIAANISAVSNRSTVQRTPPKARNPRNPNPNNSRPIATNTRSKLAAVRNEEELPSFNRSAKKQGRHIKEKTDQLQKSASARKNRMQ